jgi:hypothetical protein
MVHGSRMVMTKQATGPTTLAARRFVCTMQCLHTLFTQFWTPLFGDV